jgi:transcription initiation factor TFIID TATA-box-binding protein
MRKRRYFSLVNKHKSLLLYQSYNEQKENIEEDDESIIIESDDYEIDEKNKKKKHKKASTVDSSCNFSDDTSPSNNKKIKLMDTIDTIPNNNLSPITTTTTTDDQEEESNSITNVTEVVPIPQCHNIVSTSQIQTTMEEINLQRLASLFPFTSYDRKRFAAITIRLAKPHCTCLLFGSGKLVITGSTSFHACLVASQTITQLLREVNPRDRFEVISCVIQNIVAHVELKPGQQINLEGLYSKYCEHSTYQKSIFPGLVLRPPESPIVLLVFKSGRIVCTGGKSYDDIYYGFINMFKVLKEYIYDTNTRNPNLLPTTITTSSITTNNKKKAIAAAAAAVREKESLSFSSYDE